MKVNCHGIQTSYSDNGLVIKKDSNLVEVSNQDGMSVSCDPLLGVCSLTLDGWLHGEKTMYPVFSSSMIFACINAKLIIH